MRKTGARIFKNPCHSANINYTMGNVSNSTIKLWKSVQFSTAALLLPHHSCATKVKEECLIAGIENLIIFNVFCV